MRQSDGYVCMKCGSAEEATIRRLIEATFKPCFPARNTLMKSGGFKTVKPIAAFCLSFWTFALVFP